MRVICVAFMLLIVGSVGSACKEPMSNNAHYKATVACTAVMKERASAPGGGTTNDAKVRCIQALEKRYEVEPAAELGDLARCVLGAPTEADAIACK